MKMNRVSVALAVAAIGMSACSRSAPKEALVAQVPTTIPPPTTAAPPTTEAPTTTTVKPTPTTVIVIQAAPAPKVTTTTIDRAAVDKTADSKLIREMYYTNSQAWQRNPSDGIQQEIASAHPQMRAAASYKLDTQDCQHSWFGDTAIEDVHYSESYVPDLTSLDREDSFTLHDGDLAGQKLNGRIYNLTVNTTVAYNGQTRNSSGIVHAAVLDGHAFDFIDCTG